MLIDRFDPGECFLFSAWGDPVRDSEDGQSCPWIVDTVHGDRRVILRSCRECMSDGLDHGGIRFDANATGFGQLSEPTVCGRSASMDSYRAVAGDRFDHHA